ncbi:MAG: glycosyl hydrolase 43 family protein [Clostridiales bacterium]|nr:glycosyl hydrolase 43 family protein [Clostridiales bacterium]
MRRTYEFTNPLTRMDYPDPDVIRVDDIYYMISTTMHFMPGGVILRSYDLINWEILSYVYHTLDDTEGQRLVGHKNIYGQGMWAPSLRYHDGVFYVCFAANDTQKTYLYTSDNIEGPWKKQYIEGFYHDSSLLFDDDRVFIVYGNSTIYLTELKKDLTGKKPGGLHRAIIKEDNPVLGYEGAHVYKINGRYYVFLIHSDPSKWFRTEACFVSDSLEGEFVGGEVLADDMGYHNQGVAQGGIVDTPDGKWYAVLFQDRGAIGRIPVLVPMEFKDDFIVVGSEGRVPKEISAVSTRPEYKYQPLYESDDFMYEADDKGVINLKKVWQWNHNPDHKLWSVTDNPGHLRIRSGKLSENITQAVNTLTQRMIYPQCEAYVTVDGSGLKDGDYAGISAFQGCYGFVALHKDKGRYYLVMQGREKADTSSNIDTSKDYNGSEYSKIPWYSHKVVLKVNANFADMIDEADFYYAEAMKIDGVEDYDWKKIGITQSLYFVLDHFCGCRFALFMYSTKEQGGYADFSDFTYVTL